MIADLDFLGPVVLHDAVEKHFGQVALDLLHAQLGGFHGALLRQLGFVGRKHFRTSLQPCALRLGASAVRRWLVQLLLYELESPMP